jgi:hypothetical protein
MTPEWSLMMVAIFLVMGASNWRRRRLRRAARDLPTLLFRQLGPEPEFDPPETPSEGLEGFSRLHKRSLRIQYGIWLLALIWMGWVVLLGMGIL